MNKSLSMLIKFNKKAVHNNILSISKIKICTIFFLALCTHEFASAQGKNTYLNCVIESTDRNPDNGAVIHNRNQKINVHIYELGKDIIVKSSNRNIPTGIYFSNISPLLEKENNLIYKIDNIKNMSDEIHLEYSFLTSLSNGNKWETHFSINRYSGEIYIMGRDQFSYGISKGNCQAINSKMF